MTERSLRDKVLEYIQKKCLEAGGRAEEGPRIYTIARELNADVDEVSEIIKELEKEAVIEFRSSPGGDTYICPLMTAEDILKLRIYDLVKERGKATVYEIARLLGEEKDTISAMVKEMVDEGKLKFGGEAGASWVEIG